MQIQFCGAAGCVTGSCFLVTTESSKFLVDCGLFQGSKELKELNMDRFCLTQTVILCCLPMPMWTIAGYYRSCIERFCGPSTQPRFERAVQCGSAG